MIRKNVDKMSKLQSNCSTLHTSILHRGGGGYKTFTTLFTFTGVIKMCLARVEVLHERRWDLVGCISPQRRQVHALLMV